MILKHRCRARPDIEPQNWYLQSTAGNQTAVNDDREGYWDNLQIDQKCKPDALK